MLDCLSDYETKVVNSKKLVIYSEENRFQLLQQIADEYGGEYIMDDPGSSAGCVKVEGIRVYVKPIATPGQANELMFVQSIEQYMGDGPINVRIGERLLKNVSEVEYVAHLTNKNRKADVLFHTSDGKVPVSLKKSNASRWASVDRRYGEEAFSMLIHAVSNKLTKLDVCNRTNGIVRLTKPIARKLTIGEINPVVFGSDVLHKGLVVVNSFTPSDFVFANGTLTVNCDVIQSKDDVIDTKYHPHLMIRNDSNRNSKYLPRGIRVEIVYQNKITKNTLVLDQEDL